MCGYGTFFASCASPFVLFSLSPLIFSRGVVMLKMQYMKSVLHASWFQ